MINSEPIRENEIRVALLEYTSARAQGESVIREEFQIERGGARIDLAVIGEKLVGYEIKSELDTFARFSNQIHAYNRVFDEIYLVCGQMQAMQALELIPSWWGVLVAERLACGGVKLTPARVVSVNPYQDPFSLASLLWKDEVLAVLVSEDQDAPKRSSSYALWDHMARALPFETIKVLVTKHLLIRNYNEEAVRTR